MQERGLIGLEARDAGGEELGRISELVIDETSGANRDIPSGLSSRKYTQLQRVTLICTLQLVGPLRRA